MITVASRWLLPGLIALVLAGWPALAAPTDACPVAIYGWAEVSFLPAGLMEVSGMVSGRHNADVVWVHNDSGDFARLYALASDGTLSASFALPVGWPVDCEALAVGPAPDAPGPHLFLGDTGNNGLTRTSVLVYRLPEPDLDVASSVADCLAETEVFEVRFPPGMPADLEAFAVDPTDGEWVFFSKSRQAVSHLLTAPAPATGATVQLTWQGTLALDRVTGADISPDGRFLLLRTYAEVFLWERQDGEPWAEALSRPPCPMPLFDEMQGEAIAFAPDGSGYFTLSEGSKSELFFYPLMNDSR